MIRPRMIARRAAPEELIKTTDERGQAARLPLADIEWSDSSYAEAVRVRDWLDGYVERHGRTRR